MKRIWAPLAVVWIMLGLAYTHDALANGRNIMYVHVHEGTLLNGRREPSLDSPILMTMERGFEVEVIGVANGWVEITGGEAGTAWCCVDYLADFQPDDDAPSYTVVSNGRVRVRTTPGGKTIRYVQEGDTVTVRFVIDGWAYVGDGYVMAAYLTSKP